MLFIGLLIDAVGIPFPGDLFLIAAGYLSYRGELNIIYVIPVAGIAALIGDSATFGLGRLYCLRGGMKFQSYICKWSKCTLASRTCFERSCDSLKKLGTKSILLGKFMWGTREFIPVLNGMSGMTYKVFIRWDILSVLMWVGVFALGGYLFGSNLDGFVNLFDNVASALGVFGLVSAVTLTVVKFSQKLLRGSALPENSNLAVLKEEVSEKPER